MKKGSDTKWEYAAAPESRSIVKLEKKYGLFINGKFVPPSSKKYFSSIDPSTGEQIAEIAFAGKLDVNAAAAAANTAYEKSWKKLPAQERGKYLFRIARMIQERARELAVLESIDGGKPIRESRDFD